MSFEINPLHLIDSYKLNHVHMYPEGTDYVYSNFTARSPKHFNNANGTKINFTVFVGLQSMLQELHELWDENFFKLSWEDVEHKYKRRIRGISGKEMDVSHAKRLHEVGFLPIQVMALKEGSLVPIGVPYFTVVTTMPGHGWLTNYLEDVFSNGNWKMINNATTAYIMRKIIDDYAEKTGAVKDMSKWLGHDFSFRGMSTWHDGIRNSFAHLTSFAGSDTVAGIDFAEYYYGADVDTQLVSGSVPASEHSVACSFGQNGEIDYLDQLLKKYPDGIFSIVSDTWDFFNFITVVAMKRKDEIMSRNGKVVFRPDSGDPADILCGDENSSCELEKKGAVQLLWEQFGGTINEKGYKTLDSHVGLIYGDSISIKKMDEILRRLKDKGFTSDNVVFGIGSYTYNMHSRDTFGMAMKATYVEIDGVGYAIQKDPATGDGTKKSAKGLLNVFKEDGEYVLYDHQAELSVDSELKLVYINGCFLNKVSLEDIRKNLHGDNF